MSVTTVGPGELAAAYSAAAPNDVLMIHGQQDLPGLQLDIRKPLHLMNAKGQRATLNGRSVTHPGAEGTVFSNEAGSADPRSNGFIFDAGAGLPAGQSTQIVIGAAHCEADTIEWHNANRYIGLDVIEDATWGVGDYFKLTNFYGHHCGVWADNRGQVLYASGKSITGSDGMLTYGGNRGLQNRGDTATVWERLLIAKNRCGAMWGDLNADNDWLRHSILLDNTGLDRYLIESYLETSAQHNGFEGYAWNANGRPVAQPDLASVDLSGLKHADPKYDYTTGRLAADSPALGDGPSWIQPASAVNVPAALASTLTAISELELSDAWARYATSPTTHTYKSHAAMLATRSNLGG